MSRAQRRRNGERHTNASKSRIAAHEALKARSQWSAAIYDHFAPAKYPVQYARQIRPFDDVRAAVYLAKRQV